MKKRILIRAVVFVLSILLLLAGCQPTPETPVVVGRDEEKLEAAMAQTEQPDEEAHPYDAPKHVTLDIDGLPENYSIVFDADVVVPNQAQWPVYTVEKAHVTQEQADAVREALLGDTVLYKPGEYRSRDEIQLSIDNYEKELKMSIDEGYDDLVSAYQDILKDLYAEYENTPKDLKLEPAELQFAFMEDRTQVELYGGKEVETGDGGIRFEWTDEARAKAVAAGCESIYGVCWMANGRKMTFAANNGDFGTGIAFDVADGNTMQKKGVSYSLDEAKTRADALLKSMGLDFVLVDAFTGSQDEVVDGVIKTVGDLSHTLVYKRRIDGVPQDIIVSCIDQNLGDDFRGAVPPQETISITVDDYGVCGFFWTPMEVIAKETKNAALLPFDDIKERIVEQLKIQTMWDAQADAYEANDIVSRRLEVNNLQLSYLLIDKQNDIDCYYLLPVWNVCGDMYYHYRDDYPTGESNTYILDENFERNAWRIRNDTRDFSILTINALDGSVIPRSTWS